MSDLEARRKGRQLKIVTAAMTIRRRVGKATAEEAMVATMGTVSEMKGLWQCLLDKGLVTETQRQDYLDRGADELLRQVEGKASELQLEVGGG